MAEKPRKRVKIAIAGPIFPITSTILLRPIITVTTAKMPIPTPPTQTGRPYCWFRVAPAPPIITIKDI